MGVALISGPYFIKLVQLPVLSILSPGPGFIYLSPGPEFIKLVRFGILSILSSAPGPNLLSRQSGRSVSRFCQFLSPGAGPDFIHRVRVWILSNMSRSGSASGS